ncbi:50S ribosomal protein L7/L12 [Candidatus Roizmanbacteria bacterium]|nr:50S ribosomal protein L7/L12 [Candidatus Roizmanbacteria bacterium]
MAETKLSEKLQKLAKEIESLTLLEMADLSKYLEKRFGISATPLAAPLTPTSPGGQTQASQPSEEKTLFTVVLSASGDNKLGVIKAVREILPNLGLMEAKKLVESAPKELLQNVKKEQAEEAKKKIETAGGKIELK